MKRVQMFLAGAFIAVGSLYAQSSDAEWQAGVAKLKETIQTNPAQANEEAEQLIKGKNKVLANEILNSLYNKQKALKAFVYSPFVETELARVAKESNNNHNKNL